MKKVLAGVVVAGGLAMAGGAQADDYDLIDTIYGVNGLVSVGEYALNGGGGYAVDVAPEVVLGGFVVSHSNEDSYASLSIAFFDHGWVAENMSAADWNDAYGERFGLFANRFGTQDTHVYAYYLGGTDNAEIVPETPDGGDSGSVFLNDGNDTDAHPAAGFAQTSGSLDFMWWFGETASEFIAVDINEAVVDYSFTGEVPVPAALPMFLTGMAGIAWVRRRARKAA